MIRRQTWVLLAIFIVLLGGVFYLQKNPLPSSGADITPSPTTAANLLPGWKAEDIVFVEWKDSSKDLQLSEGNNGWTLSPDNKPVEAGKAEQIRAQLADMHVMSALPGDFSLQAGGLTASTQLLTIGNTLGKKVQIKVGKATPTDTGYYVQVDNGTPVVVDKYVVDTMQQQMSKENLIPTPTAAPSPETTATQQPTAKP